MKEVTLSSINIESLRDKFVVISVGSDQFPATKEWIEDLAEAFEESFKKAGVEPSVIAFMSHNAMDRIITIEGAKEKVLEKIRVKMEE